jgi:hypothetical protein
MALMKKVISIVALTLFCGFFNYTQAQTVKQEVNKDAKVVKKDAKKVGNKTAELASKAKSKITDSEYKDKVGPDGQTVYIDKHARYYWVDKKGHKQYVAATKLKDKQ